MTATYTQILTELASHLGMPAQKLLEQQQATFERIAVFFQPDASEGEQHIVLCSALGEIEEKSAPQVMRTLLQANHLWTGTGGGVLGLSAQGDTVTWCMQIPLHQLDGQTLFALLSEFVELGSAWAAYLGELTPRIQAAESSASMAMFVRA